MKRPNPLYIWWLENRGRVGLALLIANLAIPAVFLIFHLTVGLPKWTGTPSSGECGMGRYTFDC
jgi:hypothetical protein